MPKTDYQNICNAVRTKTGGTALLKSGELPDAIRSIEITAATLTLTVATSAGATVTASKGNLSVSGVATDGVAVLELEEAGEWTVVAELNGQASLPAVVEVVADYNVTLHYVSAVLDENSWELVRQVSDNSEGENYWSVGDSKAIVLNGTLGKLSLANVTLYTHIIGFNHNAELEGGNRIHFQVGSNAAAGGVSVAFQNFTINASADNTTGWKNSNMRTAICGTDLANYPATSMLGVISADLRAVLKSVTKYTDNTANGKGNVAANMTATVDYFTLLSSYELDGVVGPGGNSHEATYQKQYAYYAAGNSKIRYNYSATATAIIWWLRTPYSAAGTVRWLYVGADGKVAHNYTSYGYGFSPIFCV